MSAVGWDTADIPWEVGLYFPVRLSVNTWISGKNIVV
jgi:hypothetical protein